MTTHGPHGEASRRWPAQADDEALILYAARANVSAVRG